MNAKKLQLLISAGVFSAALLSGIAYADNSSTDTYKVQASSGTTTQGSTAAPDEKQKTSDKSAAKHACASSGGCASDK